MILQDRLNRLGALLAVDGLAGPRTRAAMQMAAARLGLPGDITAEALARRLETVPEPVAGLPTAGVVYIARAEIGSRAAYDRLAARPHWPGGASGITLGMGCDLRFLSPTAFQRLWGPHLGREALARLALCLGRRGSTSVAAALADIRVPYAAAWEVLCTHTLPPRVRACRRLFRGFDDLPDGARTALVSLVVNRGAALGQEGDAGRAAMRALARDLDEGRAGPELARHFEAMMKLWPEVPGLQRRRFEEAALWRLGPWRAAPVGFSPPAVPVPGRKPRAGPFVAGVPAPSSAAPSPRRHG